METTIAASHLASKHGNEVQVFGSHPERNHAIDHHFYPADIDSEDSMDTDKTLVPEDIPAPFSLKMVQSPARFRAAMRRRSCLLSPPAQRQNKKSFSEACLDNMEKGPRKIVCMRSVPDIGR